MEESHQLLKQNNVLFRLLDRVARTVEANSVPLPSFTSDAALLTAQEAIYDSALPLVQNGPSFPSLKMTTSKVLAGLRQINPDDWMACNCSTETDLFRQAEENMEDEDDALVDCPTPWMAGLPTYKNLGTIEHSGSNLSGPFSSSWHIPTPLVLSWQAGRHLGRSWFEPFERLFHAIHDVNYVLASLVNVRPLEGELVPISGGSEGRDQVSSSEPDNITSSSNRSEQLLPSPGWWDDTLRRNFMDYMHALLKLLSFVQDMNSLQRETVQHVEQELEWSSGFFLITILLSVLGLTVQVASSDRQLFRLVYAATIKP
ncbi:unnamed protein product [Protopolystoma xenopodis]|uniref:Uncharacterized protein n=1 Tax=Protopolystoma xenopodis TaxID=117903 RepID=A0A3S4ZY71_9PLAT|nr:unnamed protein product [Protopolystoma xenopodis]